LLTCAWLSFALLLRDSKVKLSTRKQSQAKQLSKAQKAKTLRNKLSQPDPNQAISLTALGIFVEDLR